MTKVDQLPAPASPGGHDQLDRPRQVGKIAEEPKPGVSNSASPDPAPGSIADTCSRSILVPPDERRVCSWPSAAGTSLNVGSFTAQRYWIWPTLLQGNGKFTAYSDIKERVETG